MNTENLLTTEEVDEGRKQRKLPAPRFPNADDIVAATLHDTSSTDKVDIMLVNPPSPDGGIWIRSQHRVGRRSRENMVWPQVSLAQMAALLHPTYKVKVVDAIAERMSWPDFKKLLVKHAPKYYLTQVTAPTLENDMYGTFLAKNRGARTIAFGTHVTPIPRETMKTYATLDFVLCGEPDLTLRDLLDTLENKVEERQENIQKLFAKHNPTYVPPVLRPPSSVSPPSPPWGEGRGEVLQSSVLRPPSSVASPPSPPWGEGRGEVPQSSVLSPASSVVSPPSPPWGEGRGEVLQSSVLSPPSSVVSPPSPLLGEARGEVPPSSVLSPPSSVLSPPTSDLSPDLSHVKGLVWRRGGELVMNPSRPFVSDLDDMPLPMHELLPLNTYRMPMLNGPFTFIVPSRGCPAACTYCIKHVSYQYSVRARTPENVLRELWQLKKLGLNNVHMYADLFTVDRKQVIGICQKMIDENIGLKWTCNSRVDFVDEELLTLMGKAGCHLIAWGIESGNEEILKHARKGANPAKAKQALTWARKAGIKNWGYFIIGLPGETETTIRETIDFAKGLPLDIALFHIAAPYPGTPFFFEVLKNGWFRPGTKWEQVDMDKETVLDYPDLPAERLEYWQKRAFREWAFRPGPALTFMKMLFTDPSMLRNALNVAMQHTSWLLGRTPSE